MSYGAWMQYLIIPFGQSVLYDLSKEIFSRLTEKYYLEKTFNTAISNGVNSILKKRNHLMADNIIESIKLSCKENEEPNLNEIVKRELQQWGEENLNSQFIASNICNNILHNIMNNSELCEIFTFKILNDLTQKYTSFYNDIKHNNINFQNSLKEINDSNKDMATLMKELYEDVQQIRAYLKTQIICAILTKCR